MTLNDYQKQAHTTSTSPLIGHPVIYPAIGLLGEAGEVANKIKKVFRDNQGEFSQDRIEELRKELGDMLWYIAEICTVLDISLDEVASGNLEKLASRQRRGTISGSGDNR